MKIVKITKKTFLQACSEFFDTGVFKGSYTKGEGVISGNIGEVLVNRWIKGKRQNSPNYDIIKNGKKVEVKTKRTSVAPLPEYTCSVYESSLHQECDIYVFVRVRYDYKEAYILGWITKEEFLKKAKFVKKGNYIDEKFKATANCYSVKIKDLKKRWKNE